MTEFIKHHGRNVSADWNRVQQLFEVSRSTPEFSSPRPLRILPDGTSIAYEMLPPGQRLGQLLAANLRGDMHRADAISNALRRTGRALASLHDRMPATSESVAAFPEIKGPAPRWAIGQAMDVIASARVCAWHGDYGHGNIWLADDGGLWIYDPVPAAFCPDVTATCAPVLFDIAHMAATLYAVYPMRLQPQLNSAIQHLWIETFIAAYENASGDSIDRATIFLLAADNLRRYAIHIWNTKPLLKGTIWYAILSRHRRRLIQNIARAGDFEQLP